MNLEEINNKIKETNKELNSLILLKQEKCPHNHVEKTGGGMWHEYPDYGYYPYYIECLDCGLSANDKDRSNIYRMLKKKVTIDKSVK